MCEGCFFTGGRMKKLKFIISIVALTSLTFFYNNCSKINEGGSKAPGDSLQYVEGMGSLKPNMKDDLKNLGSLSLIEKKDISFESNSPETEEELSEGQVGGVALDSDIHDSNDLRPEDKILMGTDELGKMVGVKINTGRKDVPIQRIMLSNNFVFLEVGNQLERLKQGEVDCYSIVISRKHGTLRCFDFMNTFAHEDFAGGGPNMIQDSFIDDSTFHLMDIREDHNFNYFHLVKFFTDEKGEIEFKKVYHRSDGYIEAYAENANGDVYARYAPSSTRQHVIIRADGRVQELGELPYTYSVAAGMGEDAKSFFFTGYKSSPQKNTFNRITLESTTDEYVIEEMKTEEYAGVSLSGGKILRLENAVLDVRSHVDVYDDYSFNFHSYFIDRYDTIDSAFFSIYSETDGDNFSRIQIPGLKNIGDIAGEEGSLFMIGQLFNDQITICFVEKTINELQDNNIGAFKDLQTYNLNIRVRKIIKNPLKMDGLDSVLVVFEDPADNVLQYNERPASLGLLKSNGEWKVLVDALPPYFNIVSL